MTAISHRNLDQTQIFRSLIDFAAAPVDLTRALDPERIRSYLIRQKYLSFSYAASRVEDRVLDALFELAAEQQIIQKYQQLRDGEPVNVGENRPVLHHKTRCSQDRGMYGVEQQRVNSFSDSVRSGHITGYSGKRITGVVQIGIGGSDLGPRALYLALDRWAIQEGIDRLQAHFIANVDPDDANAALTHIDFETTLFVLVSKSGTTQETLTNLALLEHRAIGLGVKPKQFYQQLVVVTAKGSPLDQPGRYLDIFYIDDFIGGRYSATSVVGGVVLSLAFGADKFDRVLDGAGEMDRESETPDVRHNMAVMAALIGVWERNFLGCNAKAIIPYSEALSRFPAHLQQLDCESNGKDVNVRFERVNYETGPLIFGEVGTSGQHSFFQKLHQGTDVIPIQFIGFSEPQLEGDVEIEGITSQQKLMANLVAQIVAFAKGRPNENANKVFDGNRPSSLVFGKRLTPEVLGALLSFYENVVMFQGFLWNINSFDQEGVQLGKVLTQSVLNRDDTPDSALTGFLDLLSTS